MDPSMYNLQYTAPTGLPQESKLVTYMNRSVTTPVQSHGQLGQPQLQGPMSQAQHGQAQLSQAMSNLSIEPTVINKALLSHPPPAQVLAQIPPPPLYQQVLIGDYVPINYYNPPSLIQETMDPSPSSAVNMPPMPTQPQVHQENVGGTTYFYTNDGVSGSLGVGGSMGPEPCLGAASSAAYVQQMYAPPHLPPHMPPVQTKAGMATTYYRPEVMKQEMYARSEDIYNMPQELQQYPDIPESLERFDDLVPLNDKRTTFMALDRETRELYLLRRIPCNNPPDLPTRLEIWAQIIHSNIVRFHRAFITDAFGDRSIMLVYNYYPACETLQKKYLSVEPTGAGEPAPRYHDPFSADPDAPRPYTHQKNTLLRAESCGTLLPEQVLWNIFIQLTAALRDIHSAGLACRTLEPSKVIISGCRVRISWCGIGELLGEVDVAQAQQDDFTALGQLALALSCRTPQVDNLARCMEFVRRSYSEDLNNFIMYLLNTTTIRSVTDLMPMIGGRFYNQVEALERRADALEEQLARELDNGRHLRTLAKLGSVNERPELNMDTTWSETGDRYMLKLFRDYLFHCLTPEGRPWLDQAHMAFALNNLDAGTQTKIVLTSRDNESVLVVTFAELKHCLEQAFEELMQATNTPTP